jgi:hypothetical protein
LGDYGGCSLTRAGRAYPNLELTLDVIGLYAAGDGLALAVCCDSKSAATVGENAARALVGEEERDDRSSDWTPVFILHLDNWLARDSLPDIIDSAFALNDDDVQLSGRDLSGGCGLRLWLQWQHQSPLLCRKVPLDR